MGHPFPLPITKISIFPKIFIAKKKDLKVNYMVCRMNYCSSNDLNRIKIDPRRASNSILPWTFQPFTKSSFRNRFVGKL